MDLRFETVRVSPRLRDALIADLVHTDPTHDYWYDTKMTADDVTDHLARQLGLHASRAAGLHDTLYLIATEISELLRRWPLPDDLTPCQAIAHEATKHLGPTELFATLLAGPPRWRNAQLPACKIDRLEKHFQPLLEVSLAEHLGDVTRSDVH